MKNINLIFALVLTTISTGVVAADGKITFKGEVVSQSCVVDSADHSKTVTLPKISAISLTHTGDTTGTTPFSIQLTQCNTSDTVKDVGLSFVGPNIDLETNTLKTDGVGTTTAKNVNISLYNQDDSQIKLGADTENQNTSYTTISNDKAQLNYFAKYYATGIAEPGLVETTVDFEIIYK